MHVYMTIARIARIAQTGCRALRAILKIQGFLMFAKGLHGMRRAMCRAMPQKLQCFLDCTDCTATSPLRGVCRGRANTPSGEGARDFSRSNSPTPQRETALTPNRKSGFNSDRHASAQDRADPQHGLLNEEPEMNQTNPCARLWTEAELNLLRTSWAAGLSCSEIAAKLSHRSRNAVGGMAHRLGLPVRGPGMVSRSKPRTQTPRRPTTASRGVLIRDYVPARITLAGPSWSHGGGA